MVDLSARNEHHLLFHCVYKEEHLIEKRPLGRNSRHGQIAQAATAVRSKRTIELAFITRDT